MPTPHPDRAGCGHA